ncbi:hybrid sensor histidine kinase/response regulator [Methylobacter sp. YRD-M1]|uniref:hybrid sensor histidine kinase/response regulator n=1 Tax=Methylobacter sp. YRD-M1 TaxID=2911520 RepID=UPI00227CB8F9|nr:PAS domain-containing sensor histidine kinase [Methylobacter sp. YRD-M1]WAK03232.1 ATP-binding protein [Methylobacter sp. YRD-M1]
MAAHSSKLDLILDTITDGVLVVNSQGVVLYANQAAETLLARSPIVGQSLAIPLNPDKDSHQDINLIRPDGLAWAEMRSSPLEWDGQPGYVIALRDITERKHMELERQKFVSLADNSMEFIGMFDMNFAPFYINEAGMRLIGLDSLEQCIRTPVQEFFFPEDQHFIFDEFFPRVLRDGHADVEIRFRHFKSSAPIWMIYNVFFIKDSNGEPVGIATVSRDISERKQAEAALLEADQRKDEFLAMLAHELRNPLAPISNAVQIIKRSSLDETRLAWCRDIIGRQVEHLVRLVDDLLDVSRISRNKIELKKESLEISSIVQRAVETSQPLIDARRHEFSVHLPCEQIYVEGDLVRLSQVVSNLLNNAAKYTDEGGRIRLAVEPADDEIFIRVRDNGRGIDPSALSGLFQLFYQVDRTIDRAEGGLGIGLALVKSLVAMHGGEVWAYSEGRGKGSEFVIRLPCLRKSTVAPTSCHTGARPDEGSLRILVVDDNRDAAQSLSLLLTSEGHAVRLAYDGYTALEVALAERPQIVLLDIGLPGMDGYAVARALRQDPALKMMQLIALSGYGRQGDHEQARTAGFNGYLTKPVDFGELQGALTQPSFPNQVPS